MQLMPPHEPGGADKEECSMRIGFVTRCRPTVLSMAVVLSVVGQVSHAEPAAGGGYESLVSLSNEWRQFAKPPIANCVPDYSAGAMAKKAQELKSYRSRLDAIKPDGWPRAQEIDYKLFKA